MGSPIGFSTNNPADDLLDSDHDGLNNRAEFEAGTNPSDPLSCLKITRFLLPPQFDFYAVSNKSYTVEYSDALSTNGWQKLLDLPARNTNHVETVTDGAAPGDERYYRIRTPMRP